MILSNEIIFVLSIIFYFALVLFCYKKFGKTGLYVWTAFATVLSSLEVAKVVTLFGMSVTLGNVIYGSIFLATDILSENHDRKSADTAVYIGIFVSIIWVLGTQLSLLFVPNADDFINPSLVQVFGVVPRITLSSIATYVVSQKIDIWLYHFWWKKTGGTEKFLWLRNNGSTLLSQLLDTIVFTTLAFFGTFPLNVLIELIVTTYVLKLVIGVLDTPVLYLARRIAKKGFANEEKQIVR